MGVIDVATVTAGRRRLAVKYRRGTADERVLEHSFERDVFFAEVPEYRPEPDDVILDVGAHIGTFALLAAVRVPRGRVYAVEPCAESCELLRANVRDNRVANITIAQMALAEIAGPRRLFHDLVNGNWGHTIVSPLAEAGETVAADTLANFLARFGIGRCDFAKFNCEGGEFPALLSTSATTLRRIRSLLVCYHTDLYRDATAQALIDHLEAAGFRTAVRRREAQRGWIVAWRPQEERFAGKRCVIFGAGQGGAAVLASLRGVASVIGFVDNDPDKQGAEFLGLPVYAPAALRGLAPVTIAVGSISADEISRQLEGMGYVRRRDFEVY